MFSENRRNFLFLLIILLVGFLFRVFWVVALRGSNPGDLLYERLGINLLHGNGFTAMDRSPFTPAAVRPPLYPLWIAFVHWMAGQKIAVVFYSQVFLSTITILLVYWIGKQIHSQKTGLLAAAVLALHYYPPFYVAFIFEVVLYSFLLTCGVLFLCQAWKYPHQIKSWCLAGFFMGLAALTRSELFLFPLLLLVLTALLRRALLKGVVILCLAMGVTLLPWMARNYVHFKKIIPISNAFYGTMFLVTTLDESEYDQKQHPSAFDKQPAIYATNYPMVVKTFEIFGNASDYNEMIPYDKQAVAVGMANVKKDPVKYLLKRIKELPYLWFESGNNVFDFVDKRIRRTSWKMLIQHPQWEIIFWKMMGLLITSILPYGFVLLGLWFYRRRIGDLIPLISLPLFITLIHIPFWIEVRYAVPVFPCVFVLTAIGVFESKKRWIRNS